MTVPTSASPQGLSPRGRKPGSLWEDSQDPQVLVRGCLDVPSPSSPVEQDCPQHYPTVAVALPDQVLGKPPSKAPCLALAQGCILPEGFSLWPALTPQAPTGTHCPCDTICPEQEMFSSIIFAPLQVVLRCPKPHWGLAVPTQSTPPPLWPCAPQPSCSCSPRDPFADPPSLLAWGYGWAWL